MTIKDAERLKGKNLSTSEKQILELFANDGNYKIYLDGNNNIAARFINYEYFDVFNQQWLKGVEGVQNSIEQGFKVRYI